MRPILLVLLVSYHAFCPYCGAWAQPDGTQYNLLYDWIALLSRAFRLEGFVFVSGYIFALQIIQKHKFETLWELTKSKFVRLIIPCWFFGLFYLAFFKPDLSNLPLVFVGIGHLWFLPCLFFCFIMVFPLYKKAYNEKGVFITLLLLMLFPISGLPHSLNSIFYYLFFFYLGGIFWRYSQNIAKISTRRNIFILIISFLVLLVVANLLLLYISNLYEARHLLIKAILLSSTNLVKASLATLGILTLYCIAIAFTKTSRLNENLIKAGTLGYGVYIFHQFILVWLYYYTDFPLYVGAMLPWLGFIISLVVSVTFTILVRKTKVGTKFL